jgi:hypothetical protein
MKNIIHSRISHFVLGIFVLATLGFGEIGYVNLHKSNKESNKKEYRIIMNPKTSELLTEDGEWVFFKSDTTFDSSKVWVIENSHIKSLKTGLYLTQGSDNRVYLKEHGAGSGGQSWRFHNNRIRSLSNYRFLYPNFLFAELREREFEFKSWPVKLIKIVAEEGSDPSLVPVVFVDLKIDIFGIPFRTKEKFFGNENFIDIYVPYDPEYIWDWKLFAEEYLGKADGSPYKYNKDVEVDENTEVIYLEIKRPKNN